MYDATGRPGLLVERFDRLPGASGQPVSVAVEDGAQVMGRYPSQKYAVSAEEVTRALGGVCAARAVAVQAVYRQLCFAWLTGNGDVHAKNLSVLATTSDEWRVSPAYDVPSSLPYRDHTMALSMGGKRDGLSRKSLVAFALDLGMTPRAVERTLDEVLTATAQIPDELDDGALPFAPQVMRKVTAALRNRRRAAQ